MTIIRPQLLQKWHMTHDARNTFLLFYNAIDGNFLIDLHWQYVAHTGQ